MHGKVVDLETKKGIPNAIVDIWQASSNGKYDFQDPENQVPNNLRGKFRTDSEGNYHYYCLRPTAYSLPTNGMSWEIKYQLTISLTSNYRSVISIAAASRSSSDATSSHSCDCVRRWL